MQRNPYLGISKNLKIYENAKSAVHELRRLEKFCNSPRDSLFCGVIMTYDECFSFENLLRAHRRCRVGKSHKREIVLFELSLAENLSKLHKQLQGGYKISKYKRFKVYEPKIRIIEALPYKDRLVQSALCEDILMPVLEKKLIFDNSACRKGKGTHFALERLKGFLLHFYRKDKRNGYFLKVDIKSFFASIDHQILKEKLKKLSFESKTMELLERFIDSSGDNGKGLPLGNQTSQWFALYYLDEVDRLIKEKLRIKYYIRYMDDLILIDASKEKLMHCKDAIEDVCHKLKLSLNCKTIIGRLSQGIDFLGFNNLLTQKGGVKRTLRSSAKLKIRKKVKFLSKLYREKIVDEQYIKIRVNSLKGHVLRSHSFNYLYKLQRRYCLTSKITCGSGMLTN